MWRYLIAFALVSCGLAQTAKLHEEAFVMDGHVHMINRQFYLGGDITDSYKDGQVDLPRIRKGSVKAIFFSLFSSEEYYPRRFELKHNRVQALNYGVMDIRSHSATLI